MSAPPDYLYVSTDGTAGPYIMMPVEYQEDVEKILQDLGIKDFWADMNPVRMDGELAFNVININKHVSPEKIQQVNQQLQEKGNVWQTFRGAIHEKRISR